MYFDFFGIEYIPQDIFKKIKDRITYVEYNLMILLCADFIASFSEYMISGKTLLLYINLFSPIYYKKNGKIISTFKTNMAKENVSLGFRLKNR